MSVDQKICLENKEKPSTQGNLLSAKHCPTLRKSSINISAFDLSMKIYKKFLIKAHSLPFEEIPICTN